MAFPERLAVFARAPRLGRVKTRLCPPLSSEQALDLHRALVEDTLERLLNVNRPGLRHILFLSEPLEASDALEVPPAWEVRLQQGDDLGSRLETAFFQAFSEGSERMVVVGSDSPTLPLHFIDEAFERLSRCEVVMGPSLDGGYYLVGSSAPVPELFANIRWGEPSVLTETAEALTGCGRSYALLVPWYDIDSAEDLARLYEELAYIERECPQDVPRRTVAVLRIHEGL